MLIFTLRTLPKRLKAAVSEWSSDKCPRLGAALAFYSSLSIGPLLLILIKVGELFWAKDVLVGHISQQMQNLIGKDSIDILSTIVQHDRQQSGGLLALIMSLAVLAVSASGVFLEMQGAFNHIWHVPEKTGQPFFHVVTDRFLSFAMILGTGFLLLVSLVVNTALNVAVQWLSPYIAHLGYIAMGAGWIISLAVNSVLFALIFKSVPDHVIGWRDVKEGAVITALLFDVGRIIISIYLGHSALQSTYGAAASLMVFLIWVYYTAQILYFGAEFTKATAELSNKKSV